MLLTDDVGHQSSSDGVSGKEPPWRCWNVIPGTRYHQLLHSNVAPLESELSDIETTSSDMDAHLAFLDDEIVRVKARAEQLEEERLVIRTRRNHNHAILSPLRRMPPPKSFCGVCPQNVSITSEADTT